MTSSFKHVRGSSMIVASRDQTSVSTPDETVILNARAGNYYGLDDVGARLWELVQEPIRLAELIERLCAEYDVEQTRCERDIQALLGELSAAGLIEIRDGST